MGSPRAVLVIVQQNANYAVLQNGDAVAPIQVTVNGNIRCADSRHLFLEALRQRTYGLTHSRVKAIAVFDFRILNVNAVVNALLVDFVLLNLQDGLRQAREEYRSD